MDFIDDEANKFEAYLAVRDKLLNQHTEPRGLFACAEKVMLQESTSRKRSWVKDTNTNAGAKQWGQSVSLAESRAKAKQQGAAPLTKAIAVLGQRSGAALQIGD
jgi:hypothetical protein